MFLKSSACTQSLFDPICRTADFPPMLRSTSGGRQRESDGRTHKSRRTNRSSVHRLFHLILFILLTLCFHPSVPPLFVFPLHLFCFLSVSIIFFVIVAVCFSCRLHSGHFSLLLMSMIWNMLLAHIYYNIVS